MSKADRNWGYGNRYRDVGLSSNDTLWLELPLELNNGPRFDLESVLDRDFVVAVGSLRDRF